MLSKLTQNENLMKLVENNIGLSPMPIVFLSRAIGCNKLLFNDIDAIYESIQIEAYNMVMLNEDVRKVYESEFFNELNLISEIYCKKIYCILNFQDSRSVEKSYKLIDKLLSKGWQSIYIYVVNKKKISMKEVSKYFKKKNPKCSLMDIVDVQIISYWLCLIYNIQIETQENVFCTFIKMLNFDLMKKISKNDVSDVSDMGNIMNSLLDVDRMKINKIIDTISIRYGKFEIIDDLIGNCGKSEIDKFKLQIEAIFSLEKLSVAHLFQDKRISNKDVEEILFAYYLRYEKSSDGGVFIRVNTIDDENADIEEITNFIIKNLILKLLIKEYKETKEYYFLNNKEVVFMENKKLQVEIDTSITDLKVLNDKLNSIKVDNEKLEKENKRLKQVLENAESNKSEIVALREFLFNLDNQQELYSENEDFSSLQKIKGVIIGGFPKWQQKMKETLNNWNYINIDNINFDENIIKNADVIVIFVNYISHALYYRIVGIVNRENKKIVYIKHNQNVNIVLSQISQAIASLCK